MIEFLKAIMFLLVFCGCLIGFVYILHFPERAQKRIAERKRREIEEEQKKEEKRIAKQKWSEYYIRKHGIEPEYDTPGRKRKYDDDLPF